ncbi:hypothetical protein MMC18_000571 [Xylographa bjoerkii]|nr:hypothetical protein [Xylographa bjoerkii]
MFPSANICGASFSKTGNLQGTPGSEFDENAAARALLSFTTPPSSQGSQSRKRRRTSSVAAPTTGDFFPAQCGLWDGYPVHSGTGLEVQATVSSIIPLSARLHGRFLIYLNGDGMEFDTILDRAVMAQKLARVRASKASIESRKIKEAAGLLVVLQLFPAPWCMNLKERVVRHRDSSQAAANGTGHTDPDATEDEDSPENQLHEKPVVPDQQEVERPATDAPHISANAAGKQKEKCNGPDLVFLSHSVTLPTARSKNPAVKAPVKRKSRAKGNKSTQTAAKAFEFVNQTTSSIAAHKHKRAPPTPRKSVGSGKSPTSDETPQVLAANPAGTLPTPPLRTVSASVLDRQQRKSAVATSKLSSTPERVDDEEEERKGKQERTSKSGRTIKNTERWATSGYCNR